MSGLYACCPQMLHGRIFAICSHIHTDFCSKKLLISAVHLAVNHSIPVVNSHETYTSGVDFNGQCGDFVCVTSVTCWVTLLVVGDYKSIVFVDGILTLFAYLKLFNHHCFLSQLVRYHVNAFVVSLLFCSVSGCVVGERCSRSPVLYHNHGLLCVSFFGSSGFILM